MLWQINLFEIEWMNRDRSRFVGTFDYQHKVMPWQEHAKYGICVIRSYVMTWNNHDEEFRDDRFRAAIKELDAANERWLKQHVEGEW